MPVDPELAVIYEEDVVYRKHVEALNVTKLEFVQLMNVSENGSAIWVPFRAGGVIAPLASAFSCASVVPVGVSSLPTSTGVCVSSPYVGLRSFPVRYRVWRPSPIHVGVSDLCQCVHPKRK